MESVKELIAEIGGSNTQVSASQKDENRVMKAMLNDREFKVDVYSKEGKVGEYCPAKEVRGMVASIISATTKVASQEAEKLAENYKNVVAVKTSDLDKTLGTDFKEIIESEEFKTAIESSKFKDFSKPEWWK